MVNNYKNGGIEDDEEDDSYRNSDYFHRRTRTSDDPLGSSSSSSLTSIISCLCCRRVSTKENKVRQSSLTCHELKSDFQAETYEIQNLIPDAFLYFHGQSSALGNSISSCATFRVVAFVYWTCVSALVLGMAFEDVYSFPLWFTDSQTNAKFQIKIFIFLTTWTFLILWLYLFIAMLNTLCFQGRSHFFNALNWRMRTLALVATCMVFLLYWTLEYPELQHTNYIDCQIHAVNFLIMLIDLTFCRVPFFLKHSWIPLLYLIIYLVFSFIYYIAGGTNPMDGSRAIYPVLDYAKPLSTSILILLVLCIGYPIVNSVLWIYGKWSKKIILSNSSHIEGYYVGELENDGFLVTPFLSTQSSGSW